ncbi:hypothetical protein EPO05_01680 [Patescibacteria group bacterium]|nr:MAG: hypothetical protein EPO05_01680 [Patescibacteria group bacterium]
MLRLALGHIFTQHALFKMQQYGLSEQRVRRVIRAPQRLEEGIVKNTIAVMQPVSEKRVDGKMVWKQEIWVMYILAKHKAQSAKREQNTNKASKTDKIGLRQLKIISAWRYPGVSPKRNPIPEEILRELASLR